MQIDPVPLDLSKADKHLEAAQIGVLENARILDVGCGRGDLTCGLGQSTQLKDCDVYAFDHSIESVRQAAAISSPTANNRVHFSVQDASKLYFPEASFDLVVGSAILHHILDYRSLLVNIGRILKPNGTAVFSEPFFNGYFWPTLLIRQAADELKLALRRPEFGLAGFIINLVNFMAHHSENQAALESLTDKHFFREESLSQAAKKANFQSATFLNVAPAEFYAGWMRHFMDTYRIQHPRLRRSAEQKYDRLKALAGPLLPELVGHFKYIILRK